MPVLRLPARLGHAHPLAFNQPGILALRLVTSLTVHGLSPPALLP